MENSIIYFIFDELGFDDFILTISILGIFGLIFKKKKKKKKKKKNYYY